MKDFICCGMTLPTLHDLLQHREEAPAQKEPAQYDGAGQPATSDQRAAIATNTAAQIQHEAQRHEQTEHVQGGAVQPTSSNWSGFNNTWQTIPDMDTVEDMEMDDVVGDDETTPPFNMFAQLSDQSAPSIGCSSMNPPQVPQSNTNMMQSHQAHSSSTPNTPITDRNSAAMQGANISSTLNLNPMQQFQDLQNIYRGTPDSSAPGTPGEYDESIMAGMDDMSMEGNCLYLGANAFGGQFGFGMSNDIVDLCINEPTKRPLQTSTQSKSQDAIHKRLGSGQYGPNSAIAKRIREQQIAAGLPDTNSNLQPHEEPRPFRCPVIGCEKTYKNQNGLKYHKTVRFGSHFCFSLCPLTYYSTVIKTSAFTRTEMAHSQ